VAAELCTDYRLLHYIYLSSQPQGAQGTDASAGEQALPAEGAIVAVQAPLLSPVLTLWLPVAAACAVVCGLYGCYYYYSTGSYLYREPLEKLTWLLRDKVCPQL
jgi:hypothetical protein